MIVLIICNKNIHFLHLSGVDRHIAKEMTKFYSSRVATLLMDAGIMFVSVTLLGFNDKIMKLIVQVIVTVLNYVFSKLMVFKKKGKDVNNECEI